MSCDLLDDVEYEGATVLLTMRASGFAELTILEPDEEDKEGSIATLPLTPNQLGVLNAERIISALEEWCKHIKLVGLFQETK